MDGALRSGEETSFFNDEFRSPILVHDICEVSAGSSVVTVNYHLQLTLPGTMDWHAGYFKVHQLRRRMAVDERHI